MSFSTIRAFDARPNTVPSMKVMPSDELDPDWTTSPLWTLSPMFSTIETPLRITVALPASLVTWPMTLAASARAGGLGVLDVAGERADDVAGELGAIGRRQRGALFADEIILDDVLAAVLRQDQIGAGALVVAGEQQIGVGDRDGVGVAVMRKFMDANVRCRKRAGRRSIQNLPAKFNAAPRYG